MRIPDAFALAYPLEILVVNEKNSGLAPTKLHLSFLGYEPDEAFSATEVLEMAGNKQYDIILLDSRVPHSEWLFDLAARPQDDRPIFIGLFGPDVSAMNQPLLGRHLDGEIQLPVKRKEFLSQLKACSVLAGRCPGVQ